MSLNYEFFKTNVQPVFLKKRPGNARCLVCHRSGGVTYLQPLSPGATTWDEEQSRKNFEAVKRLVVPGAPLKSKLLMHPLAEDSRRRRVPWRRPPLEVTGRSGMADAGGVGTRPDGE